MKIFSEKEIREMIDLYYSGLSCRLIANKFRVSTSLIERKLKKNKVVMRSVEEAGRKYQFNQDFFKEINTEEKAYFLGFIIADGSINKKRNCLKIAISSEDEEILFKFAQAIEIDPKKIKKCSSPHGYSSLTKLSNLHLSSKKIITDLAQLGIHQNKTFTVKCPVLKQEMRRHLWRGILDGDGWISLRNKDGYLPILECGICGNEYIINAFSELLNSLQIKHHIGRDKSIFRIKLNGERGLKFLNYLYQDANIFLERKKEKFDFYTKEKEKQINKNSGKIPGIYKTKYNSYSVNSCLKICGSLKRLGTFKTIEEAINCQKEFHKKFLEDS